MHDENKSAKRLAIIRHLARQRKMTVARLTSGTIAVSLPEIESEFDLLPVNDTALLPIMESTSDDSESESISEDLAMRDLRFDRIPA